MLSDLMRNNRQALTKPSCLFLLKSFETLNMEAIILIMLELKKITNLETVANKPCMSFSDTKVRKNWNYLKFQINDVLYTVLVENLMKHKQLFGPVWN